MGGALVVQLETESRVRNFCSKVLKTMQTEYSTDPARILQASLLIVNTKNIEQAYIARSSGYKGRVVLHTASPDMSYGDYKKLGVDEVVKKPTSKKEFRGVISKHVSLTARILSIEDDQDTRGFLKDVITEFGYTPLMANNAESALEHVSSAHVVLSDVRQPGSIGGYGLLEKVRKQYDGYQLPVIFVCAGDLDMQRIKEAQAFFKKPLTRIELLKHKIEELVPDHLRTNNLWAQN